MVIGSIIDVFLSSYRLLTGRFYQNFDKIDQKVILPVLIWSKSLNLIGK